MDLLVIANGVLARRSEGVIVPFRRVGIGDWLPREHYCHDNVAAWVYRSPQHKPVQGFHIFDFTLLGFWRIQAHSIVELEDGTLMDITPNRASQRYPFVRHTGTNEEFAAVEQAIQIDVPTSAVR